MNEKMMEMLLGDEAVLAKELSGQLLTVIALRSVAGKRGADNAFVIAATFACLIERMGKGFDLMMENVRACDCKDPACKSQGEALRDFLLTLKEKSSNLLDASQQPDDDESLDQQIEKVLTQAVEEAQKISGK